MSEVAAAADDIARRVRQAVGAAAPDRLPLHEPLLGDRERAYVSDCVETGWVSSVGSYVDRFEHLLAERMGVVGAVAVSTGTAALEMALRCAGVELGDEVLVPSLTFVGTAAAIIHAGATPHFVDVEPDDYCVSAAALEGHLQAIAERRNADGRSFLANRETGRRIRALVAVHLLGVGANMPALVALCRRYDLLLIEDAAEALGSESDGRACGAWGAAAALSFNGNKIATTGGGGAVLSDDPVLLQRVKHLTTTAKIPHRWAYDHDAVGWNYRLPNINAALGCAQLERLDSMLAAKKALFDAYLNAFDGCSVASIWRPVRECGWNRWLIALELADPERLSLDSIVEALHQRGVLVRPLWKPLDQLAPYADAPRGVTVTAKRLADRVVTLPSGAALGPEAAS